MALKIVYKICCGIDVHKTFVVACIATTNNQGVTTYESHRFSTYTKGLKELLQWLLDRNCKDICMESTGKYWIPVFNILEDSCNITLANPRFVKNMPGKKTDPNDSRWLGKLHRHGLVPGSFIPPKDIRQLRELTRYRTKLTNMRSSEKNRLQNSLTVCNIMLSSVVSDIFGLSSRKIIEALLNGEDLSPDNLRELVHGKLHKKIPDLQEALNGKLTEHQISKIKVNLEHFLQINECLAEVDLLILEKTKPYQYYISLLETIPGIKQRQHKLYFLKLVPICLFSFQTNTYARGLEYLHVITKVLVKRKVLKSVKVTLTLNLFFVNVQMQL